MLHHIRRVTNVGPEFIALYDFDERTSEDLSFQKGECLEILDSRDDDWYSARSLDTGCIGYIPSNYIVADNKTMQLEVWVYVLLLNYVYWAIHFCVCMCVRYDNNKNVYSIIWGMQLAIITCDIMSRVYSWSICHWAVF